MGKFCVRVRLTRGANFDIVIGYDLTKEEHQRDVIGHISVHRPFVVIMGPLCTSFGHRAHLSKVVHPKVRRTSRRIGEILATSAASVCALADGLPQASSARESFRFRHVILGMFQAVVGHRRIRIH